ncbi:MAG: type II toxin-antitoxin system HicB family antitoxin [Tannerella sp.]|jgi:predicted RNase H-like HicB family nuclease|nr:type II toxin-antitoxin system HicB family antitoxin [Tannerella sp.]
MKTLRVIVCKAGKGVSAHLPEIDGYVIARNSVEKLKKELPEGIQFHIEGLYNEERQPWMSEEYGFEYVYHDIPALLEAYNGIINQSSLARISGINESLMRQYVSGIKKPTSNTLQRIKQGLSRYANELQSISFAL